MVHYEDVVSDVALRDTQAVDLDAQLLRVNRVQRVVGINNWTFAFLALRLSVNLQGQCGFTRGFRSVNLNHTSFGQAADTEGGIHAYGAGGYGGDGGSRPVSPADDSAVTRASPT